MSSSIHLINMSFICILSDCAKYQHENSNMNDIIYEQNIFKLDCTDSDLNALPPHSEPIEYEDQKEVSKDKLEQNTDHEDSCLIDIKPEIDHTTSNKSTIRYTKTSIEETDANPSNISQTLERDPPAHEFHKAVMSAGERSARYVENMLVSFQLPMEILYCIELMVCVACKIIYMFLFCQVQTQN